MDPDREVNENGKPPEDFTEGDPLHESHYSTKPKKASFASSFVESLKTVTVEPSIFFFIISTIMTILTSVNLNLEKACRVNLNYTQEICDALKERKTEGLEVYEREVQKLTATTVAIKSIPIAVIPCIAALFVGSWTDRTGLRKIFIVFPIVVQLFLLASNFINTYFFYELPLEAFVYTEAILDGISGNWCIIILVAHNYINATTDSDRRTFRIGILNFCMTVGFPVGTSLSGPLIKHYGYYAAYGVALLFHLLNLFYSVVFIKDTEKTEKQKMHVGKGFCHYLKLFFDFNNVKETFKALFRSGKKIFFLLFILSICYGTMFGEVSLLYLLTRYRYNWDEVKFGLYQSYNFITHTVGVIFSITLFTKYLKWHDAILGIISSLSKIASSFVFAFAYTEKLFYLGPLVEMLNGTATIAIRSMMSKSVPADDFGKVNSIFSLTETLMPLIYVPLYTKVYTASIGVFPGYMFLMSGAFMIPVLFAFLWLFYDYRIRLKKKISKLFTGSC